MNTLKKIIIKNYRSIELLEIAIPNFALPTSNCFGLVGINEAGKSSILKAIALKDNITAIKINQSDFKIDSSPITIEFKYQLEGVTEDLRVILGESISERAITSLKTFSANYTVNYSNPNVIIEDINFDKSKISENTDSTIIEKLKQFYKNNIQKTVFWTADEKHLINKPISLNTFINNPEGISVPLFNCFKLAEINDISNAITKALGDPAERDYLEEMLGIAVTNHVKETWKNNSIEIKLKINENSLNFLVKDLDSKNKSKTVDQRSDGFKQFISFLLTISAESKKEILKNTILLIDEPETHLHPMAQGDLLNELWNISSSELNNMTFFATHSNYLISKNNLLNYFHVTKNGDSTRIEQFNKKVSDYSEVNYLVFNIISTDYHNSLYGRLASEIEGETKDIDQFLKDKLKKKYIEKPYIKKKSNGTTNPPTSVSLQTYIRHLIHHPENTHNEPYTEEDLNNSTIVLIDILNNLD